MSLANEDFRSNIVGGPADGISSFFHQLGEPEISQLEIPFLVYQDVFWFQISIGHRPPMQVVQREHYLCGVEAACEEGNRACSSQIGKELSSWDELHDMMDVKGVLLISKLLYDKLAVHRGQDVNFVLNVIHLFLLY